MRAPVDRAEPGKAAAAAGRYPRPADVDERTWRGLKNATRWMLVQKYGLGVKVPELERPA